MDKKSKNEIYFVVLQERSCSKMAEAISAVTVYLSDKKDFDWRILESSYHFLKEKLETTTLIREIDDIKNNKSLDFVFESRSIFRKNNKNYNLYVLYQKDKPLYETIKNSKFCSLVTVEKDKNNAAFIKEIVIQGSDQGNIKKEKTSINEVFELIDEASDQKKTKRLINKSLFEDKNKFDQIFNGKNPDSLDYLLEKVASINKTNKIPKYSLPVEFVTGVKQYFDFDKEDLLEYLNFLVDNPSYMEEVISKYNNNKLTFEFEKDLVLNFFAAKKRREMEDIFCNQIQSLDSTTKARRLI